MEYLDSIEKSWVVSKCVASRKCKFMERRDIWGRKKWLRATVRDKVICVQWEGLLVGEE